MTRKAKRNLLALHREINKDRAKTIKANTPGGRYYKATPSERFVSPLIRKP